MSKRDKTKYILFVLWVCWLIFMFYFLTQNGEDSSRASIFVTELFLRVFPSLRSDPVFAEYMIRKTAHFGSYACSGMLGMFALRLTSLRRVLPVHLAVHAALAVLSEVLQLLSPGRCCSPADMCIDFVGACCGLAIASLILLILRHKKGVSVHDKKTA